MWLRTFALSVSFVTYGAPAVANNFYAPPKPKPRKITTVDLGAQNAELLAVTPKTRDAMNVGPVRFSENDFMLSEIPGQPKPAVVSVDLKFHF